MNSKETVAKYLEDLAVRGQYYFVLADLLNELGVKKNSISVSLSRLAKIGKIQMIRKGFGIYTGHTTGVLDPSYFLNEMMKHLDAKYYVGLLNAAAYRGASHQAVMRYTVVANKVIKPVNLKKLIIDFVTKNHFDKITEIEKVSGLGGYYNISSPELTAIDLVHFPKKSGQLNNVAIVLNDLIDSINFEKFKKIIEKSITPTTVLQRLGYVLDEVLGEKKISKCIEDELKNRRVQIVPLSITKAKENKKFSVNNKWNIRVNTRVEPDQ